MRPLYPFVPLLLFLAVSGFQTQVQKTERYVYTSRQMGTLFRVVLYAPDESIASEAADSAFQRADKLNDIFSDYQEDSELNRLASTAGSGEEVNISRPLFNVLAHALNVSEETNGAFDITAAPYVRLWREIRNDPEPRLPSDETLQKASEAIGYRYIQLNEEEQTAKLEKPGMQLDLGGIAKGYTADEMQEVIRYFGIDAALIDAGGDMIAGDAPPDRNGWDIAVSAHNRHGEQEPFLLTLTNTAVSTSGDLYQYVDIDSVRYSHIVDPRTGYGITERRTVTVIGENGKLSDACSTALSVLSVSEGLELIESKPGFSAYIEVNDNGAVEHFESEGFRQLRER